MTATLESILAVAVVVLVLFTAVKAVTTSRTPQGAMGWAVFIIAAPYLALPAFLIFGHHRFHGYITARRNSQEVIEAIRRFASDKAPDAGSTRINLGPFERIAGMPAARGNDIALLIDGQATFDAIFKAIDGAMHYVLVQFYIIHDDQIGRAFQARLIAAAKRGVTVRLITDPVGSHALPNSYSERLRAAGVQVHDRRSLRGPKTRFQINYRNHRKTVIVDGTTGFIGGLNVGDEYMGRDPRFGPWRDTHARLSGPMATQLQLIFVEDWHWATDVSLLDDLDWHGAQADADLSGLIVATGPADEEETGSLMFFSAITEARDRFWIATPYFVPDLDILTALKHAAMRGVDVRILVPDLIDHKMPWLAAFAYFDEVRAAGVRVFRYTGGFMHQKAFVVDDSLGAIGTSNLDNRSFRLNFEAMALIFDAGFAGRVAAMLQADFDHAFELKRTLAEQPAHIRHGAPLARLFAPVL